jgi:hypothetical protein
MLNKIWLALARSVVLTALNLAAQRVLGSIDHTDKITPAEKEAARGAVLQLVQELGKELGVPTV